MSQLDKSDSKTGMRSTMPDATSTFYSELDDERTRMEKEMSRCGVNTIAMRNAAIKGLSDDRKERSSASMAGAIDQFNELGKGHGDALQFYQNDWLSRDHVDQLSGHRGAAILCTAAGETRLLKGTFIPNEEGRSYDNKFSQLWHAVKASFTVGRDDQFNYILPERNIDLGGQAMLNLQSAKIELEMAKTCTESLFKRDNHPREAEVNDLNRVEQRVDLDLQKIYGKHDIPGIYHSLEDYTYTLHQKPVGELRAQVKARLDNPGTTDHQYVGKLWRDLALIDLAFAGIKVGYNGIGHGGDAVSANIMLKEARTALEKAHTLDSKNEDLPQLDKIARDISRRVPEDGTR